MLTSSFVPQKDPPPPKHYGAQKGHPSHPRGREAMEGVLEQQIRVTRGRGGSHAAEETEKQRCGSAGHSLSLQGASGPLPVISPARYSNFVLGVWLSPEWVPQSKHSKASSKPTGHHFYHFLLVKASLEPVRIQREGP